jgi:hypothetical protein
LPAPLSHEELFLYGALGAFGALLVVQVLPVAFSLAHGATLQLSFGRVLGAIVVILIFVALGGVTALLVADGSSAVKYPLTAGLGWQSTIGGLIQGTRTIP